MRDLIFQEMTDERKSAYEAGIFTEFLEQRAPGHTVLDDKIYRKGMLDFQGDIRRALANLDYGSGRRPARPHRGSPIGCQDGPCSRRRDVAQPEIY